MRAADRVRRRWPSPTIRLRRWLRLPRPPSTWEPAPSSRSRRPRPTPPSCSRSPRCRRRCPATRPMRRPWRRSRTRSRPPSSSSPTSARCRRNRRPPTAREWALKLKELARVFADPYSAADFEHGPLALLEPGVPVLATVRPGPTSASLVELLQRLRSDLDADLAIVSEDDEALALARWPFRLPSGTPEWLGPIV